MALDPRALLSALDAAYDAEFHAVAPILAEERRLRQSIRDLEARVRTGRSEVEDRDPMRLIGADIAWENWAERSRDALNIDLARVLARKAHVMDRLRRAFGRREAARVLAERDRRAVATVAERRRADDLAEAAILGRGAFRCPDGRSR